MYGDNPHLQYIQVCVPGSSYMHALTSVCIYTNFPNDNIMPQQSQNYQYGFSCIGTVMHHSNQSWLIAVYSVKLKSDSAKLIDSHNNIPATQIRVVQMYAAKNICEHCGSCHSNCHSTHPYPFCVRIRYM